LMIYQLWIKFNIEFLKDNLKTLLRRRWSRLTIYYIDRASIDRQSSPN
jgi:hypothetical protein